MKKIILFSFVLCSLLFGICFAQTGWDFRNPLPQVSLYSVKFPTPAIGYTVGQKGTVMKTINAGENWNFLAMPTLKDMYSVYFLDENTGYVAGDSGLILYTSNGVSWTRRNTGTT